jgi:hypothetical protein
MHTTGPVTGAGANADSPAGDADQQPIHPRHFGPTLACCAAPTVETTASKASAVLQRFIVMFMGDVLMDEA